VNIEINGEQICYARVSALPKPDQVAMCEPPGTHGRQIQILDSLTGVELLDALLHETIHAADWKLSEKRVAAIATAAAKAAWQFGYRKCELE
jgi:uroporphyrinogen-III synthase